MLTIDGRLPPDTVQAARRAARTAITFVVSAFNFVTGTDSVLFRVQGRADKLERMIAGKAKTLLRMTEGGRRKLVIKAGTRFLPYFTPPSFPSPRIPALHSERLVSDAPWDDEGPRARRQKPDRKRLRAEKRSAA